MITNNVLNSWRNCAEGSVNSFKPNSFSIFILLKKKRRIDQPSSFNFI